MGAKKKSFLLPLIFLILLPMVLIGSSIFIGYLAYQRQKAILVEKIEKLPVFDETEEAKKIAAESRIKFPPVKPSASFKELKAQVDKIVGEKTENEYPPREMSRQILSVMKKYSTARVGDEISFSIEMNKQESVGSMIKGVYKGKKSEASGVIIMLDDEKINQSRISEEYYYLFDESVSRRVQEREIASFKANYQSEREAFVKKTREEAENDIYREAGYSKDSEGKWFSDAEFLKKETEKLKKAFDRKREKEIMALKEKNRFLGFIPISIKEQAGKD